MTTWGPEFWRSQFGYPDFDAFYAEAEDLIKGFQVFGFSLPTEAVARLAWYNPGLAQGVYLAARLADYSDPNGGTPFAAWQNAAVAALRTQQENTVPTLIIPNAFQVAIEAEAGGQPVVNVIGVTNAAGTAAGAAAAVKAAWEQANGPLSRLSSLVSARLYRAVDLSSAFGDIAEVTSSAVGGVTTTNSLSTLAASALVTWNGSTRSRSTRGRMYYGPLTETNLNPDGRTLPTATLATFNTMFDLFRTSLASAGYPLAVLSRKNEAAYPVTSSAVQSVIATQRRRIR